MDSISLATAITNYWKDNYPRAEGQEQDQDQPYTIGSIQRQIKKVLLSHSIHTWLAKLDWNSKEINKAIYKDDYEHTDV